MSNPIVVIPAPTDKITIDVIWQMDDRWNQCAIIHSGSVSEEYGTIRMDAQMSRVKELVNVKTHRQPICARIFALILEWNNVSRFQHFGHCDIGNYTAGGFAEDLTAEPWLIGPVSGFSHPLPFNLRDDIRFLQPRNQLIVAPRRRKVEKFLDLLVDFTIIPKTFFMLIGLNVHISIVGKE